MFLNLHEGYINQHYSDEICDNYLKGNKEFSEGYKEKIKDIIDKGINTIGKYGCIPYNYKQMALSPRIIPVNYSQTINGVKKEVRFDVYENAVEADTTYAIMDFDLKPCYTTI